MNHRERIRTALAHKKPDYIPFDLDATGSTGIHWLAYLNLRKYLGLPELPLRIRDPMQQLAACDEDLLEYFQVDVRLLELNAPSGWRLEISEQGGSQTYKDEWGIIFYMPQDGLYFDPGGYPLGNVETVQEVERFRLPDAADPARFLGLAKRAQELSKKTGSALVLGCTGAGVLETAQWLRGFEHLMIDLLLDPKLFQAILEKVAEFKISYWNTVLPQVKSWVDVIGESDDLGGQRGPLISLDAYRTYLKPLHERILSTIKRHTDAPISFHSCGSVWDFLPDLIEIGVDILNPVQVNAAKMDTKALKREFGNDLAFWGGGCDTQAVLPRGTPRQVRAEVKRRIEDLGPGGGFVFGAVHNIQADVPPENIVAMWEAWRDYGGYNHGLGN